MSRELTAEVILAANKLADKDLDILAADRRSVVFCSIEELELILAKTNETQFLRTLSSAIEDKFAGWLLSSVDRELAGGLADQRPSRRFPFDFGDVLPWWSKTRAMLVKSGDEQPVLEVEAGA